jgi:glycosyltransferase involved in cell wall biosynthesis
VVARFEPENHVREIVEGYIASRATLPLVVVGHTPYSGEYQVALQEAIEGDPRIQLVGSVWDQDMLDQLYANCRSYLHGHSVGGTNPSLLRAMGAGAPVTAYDVTFNRETTDGHGQFFTTAADLSPLIENDESHECSKRGLLGREHVTAHYRWDDVARDYLDLCTALAEGRY